MRYKNSKLGLTKPIIKKVEEMENLVAEKKLRSILFLSTLRNAIYNLQKKSL